MSKTLKDALENFPALDRFDREILAAHVLGKPREFVMAHPNHPLTPDQAKQLRECLRRREAHEPIAYIVGHKEFFGLEFLVTSKTLVPRPETELLVEKALEILTHQNRDTNRWLVVDVGTGSGNIIISLAHSLSGDPFLNHSDWYGLDISSEALRTAKQNARRITGKDFIGFLRSDLLAALPKQSEGHQYGHILILANLPYLSHDIYASAPEDVRHYEPMTALVSEDAGLQHYRRLLTQIQTEHDFAAIPIDIVLEISPEQHLLARQLVQTYFPNASIHILRDLTGRYRLVHIAIHSDITQE